MNNFGDFIFCQRGVMLPVDLRDEDVLKEYHKAVENEKKQFEFELKRKKVREKLISRLGDILDESLWFDICRLDSNGEILKSWVDDLMKEDDPIKAVDKFDIPFIL